MSIIVKRSSDKNYLCTSFFSSPGFQFLEEFTEHIIHKQKKSKVIRFQPIRNAYNSESSAFLQAQMEEADEAHPRQGNF